MTDATRRIFTRQPRKRARRRFYAVVVALAAISLMSCSETTYWSPAESPKQPRVDWIHFDHRVMFGARDHDIDVREDARLQEFLTRVQPRYHDQVLVGTGTEHAEGEMGIERVAAVAEYLRGHGLKVKQLPGVPQSHWDGAVHISVGRYVVTPPDCPDWSKSSSYDPRNELSSNFGCATATNLGLMVADPGDLVRGREMGPADGMAAVNRMNVYRSGDQFSSPMMAPEGLPPIKPEYIWKPELKSGGGK